MKPIRTELKIYWEDGVTVETRFFPSIRKAQKYVKDNGLKDCSVINRLSKERKFLAKVSFSPVIYSDDSLNNASHDIGRTECSISGKTKENLFENIREKIWAMSSEACIVDKNLSEEYNRWIADKYDRGNVPTEINNIGQMSMYFALPYSTSFKKWLRNNN